jgi:hypothetical protein
MSLGTAVVILAVYDFLVEMASGCGKQRRHFEPFVQSVVQMQVEQVVQKGLDKGVFQMGRCPSLAAALSWAIYGAAITALRSAEPAGTADSERFVDDVYALLLPLLMPNGAGASHAE